MRPQDNKEISFNITYLMCMDTTQNTNHSKELPYLIYSYTQLFGVIKYLQICSFYVCTHYSL